MVDKIPAGYHSVNPYLIVSGASQLIDFMSQVFGAEERFRMPGPGGTIGHAELGIGDSTVMLSDGGPMNPPTTGAMLMVYVDNVDETYRKALAAGATSREAPNDKFYGDRGCSVTDPLGLRWEIATHIEDVSPEEMERRMAAAMPAR